MVNDINISGMLIQLDIEKVLKLARPLVAGITHDRERTEEVDAALKKLEDFLAGNEPKKHKILIANLAAIVFALLHGDDKAKALAHGIFVDTMLCALQIISLKVDFEVGKAKTFDIAAVPLAQKFVATYRIDNINDLLQLDESTRLETLRKMIASFSVEDIKIVLAELKKTNTFAVSNQVAGYPVDSLEGLLALMDLKLLKI